MGKTLSKTLSGAAWARHAMCESAFREPATAEEVAKIGSRVENKTAINLRP